MHRTLVPLLLFAAALFNACGSGAPTADRSAAKKLPPGACVLRPDVALTGPSIIVRCVAGNTGEIEIQSWSWGVSNGRIFDSSSDGAEVWVRFDSPGSCMARVTGHDADGNARCTAKAKLDRRNDADANPLCLLDIAPPAGSDGAHHLRFGESLLLDGALSYDPEGYASSVDNAPDEKERGIATYQWTLYRDTDSDGDGVLDYMLTRIGGLKMEIEVIEYRNGDSHALRPDGDGNCPVDPDGDGRADILLVSAYFNPKELTVKSLVPVVPPSAGTYVFELVVTDNAGLTAMKKGTVKFFNEAK